MLKTTLPSIAAIAILILSGCGRQETSFRSSTGATWGTTYSITYKADRDLTDSIRAAMREVELSLSPFEPKSIISAINRGENPQINDMIAEVFKKSQQVHLASGGAFDPTLGPLIRLWGFGEDKGVVEAPSQERIDSALATVGILECAIVDRHIVKKHPATQFNFSAITKGLGCDMVAETLRRNGVKDYMVEIGGEIAVGGKNPQGEDWHIQIDAPVESDGTPRHERMAVIHVTDCGIATSGNYRNYRDYGTKHVGHTIDPRTGCPTENTTLCVTIVAASAMLADALATACMVMPIDSALMMVHRIPTASALMVAKNDKSGELEMRSTTHFPPIFK